MNILITVPDKTNFLSLLKEALADNQPYAYKRVPWGRSFYIHQDTVQTMVEILGRLDDGYRDDLLECVPLRMTELAMKCWEIKENQIKFRNWFKYREPSEREYYQYEFEFIRRKYDKLQYNNLINESCPFCGHKAY